MAKKDKTLTNNQRRCEDCPYLKIENKVWTCEECFGQEIEQIDDCPEGVTVDMIDELDQKAKENRIKHGARAEATSEPRTRTVNTSDIKKEVFSTILSALNTKYGEENVMVKNENKLILVRNGEKAIKIDVIDSHKTKFE